MQTDKELVVDIMTCMKYLEEAIKLVKKDTPYTLSNYQQLLQLRDQATGEEASRVGELVEEFLNNCPVEVLRQIMGMDE